MILILSKYKSLQKSLLQTWREGLQAHSDTEPGSAIKGKHWLGEEQTFSGQEHPTLVRGNPRVGGVWHN